MIKYIGAKGALSTAGTDTPARIVRSNNYSATIKSIRMTEFNKYGSLCISLYVGDYMVYLEYDNFKYLLERILRRKDLETSVITVIHQVSSRGSIRIGCTCPDFVYRFKYLASKKKYLTHAMKLEGRPAKITNPDNKGVACKHALIVVKNSTTILSEIIPYLVSRLSGIYGGE